jgi:signal-transduction protein with cAMP-binding, CBS, and nucleotidyltransferase domain
MNAEISKIPVRDAMTTSLVTVGPLTTVYQVAKMMEQGGFGSVLVKEKEDHIGILTDRDFAIKIAAKKYPLDTPVRYLASFPLHTVEASESILVAAHKMSTKKIRKLVVVEQGKVVGIITSTGIVNQLSKMVLAST